MTRRKISTDRKQDLPADGHSLPAIPRHLELVVRNSPYFVALADLEGTVLWRNEAALRLTGNSGEKMVRLHLTDFLIPEERDLLSGTVLPAVRQRSRWEGELTLQHFETGEPIAVLCQIVEINDPESSEPAHYAIFARDLTEQKRREGELHDAQQRVSSVLAAGEVGTWTFDVESQRVVVDENLRGMFSLSPEEAQDGRLESCLRMIHPDDLPGVESAIASAIEEGLTYYAEYRIVRKDGSTRFVIARGNVERDEAGKAVSLPGVVLDITDRVRAQKERREISAELERSEERLRVSLEAGRIGAWELDLVKGDAWRSLQHDQVFGYQELVAEWSYEVFLKHVLPEDRARVDQAFHTALEGRDVWELECRIRRADGEVRWIAPHGRVSRNAAGEAIRMVGIVTDITARKEAEEALRESEAKFRQLADTIPQLAWMADAGGSIFWYNQRWYDYTGTQPAEMEGWGWQSVHDPNELPTVLTRWKGSIASGQPFDMIFPLKGADGKFRRFLTRVMPFRNDEGHLTLWFGTNTDIEDQRQIEETLRERREQLALALEAGQLGTWQLDTGTMELMTSAGCRKNYGLADDAPFTYATLWEMMHPEDIERTRDAVRRAIENKEGYLAEYRVLWPDGSVHWISARGRPVDGGEGKALRLIGITQDITDAKLASEQREHLLDAERSARSEAERVGRMKDEFLATLSHELRTPLNAIFGWTQLMKSGGIEPKLLAEGIDVIDRNVRAQTRLIEDLLDMSRVISGKLRLDVQHLDPGQSVDAAVETVRPAAEAKGIRIEKILDSQAGPISGDPGRIQQIFWNLLSNAIKFTPRGGKVQVLLERVDSHLEITVADTGQGISPEFLPYVFDRFRQADAAANRRHGGLGLGLAIAKQLVELHGGSIRVESKGPGKGTAFIVSLPLQVLQAHLPRPDRRHPRATTQTPLFEKCTDLAGLKVLVVDDERDARELLRIMLENCEAEVVTASSAAEALPLVKSQAPDVLVSDIGMAEVDGYEFLRQVRVAEPRGRKIPAIALTAFARSEDRTKALRSGFSAHISKPVEPAELIATIVSVIDRPRKNDAPSSPPAPSEAPRS